MCAGATCAGNMTTRAVFKEGLKGSMPASAAWARVEGFLSAFPYTTLTDDNVDEETGLVLRGAQTDTGVAPADARRAV